MYCRDVIMAIEALSDNEQWQPVLQLPTDGNRSQGGPDGIIVQASTGLLRPRLRRIQQHCRGADRVFS
jgi:hypothetical protein